MLYERLFSTAHLLLLIALNFLFGVGWYLATSDSAPPWWARLCGIVAAVIVARPLEATLARRHARRKAARRRQG
ncbi:hypothetical protein [Streptomyces marianii]|uniref:Uncharacterized protein n=1 Tax=Streptomyces marianii TaxID=1817406 RepID=A0A5R9DTV5_9ACTN|nr:hypothetical protein [Streptomyces marianii]TLQ39201.1 hypothetical protein FEF34_38020 [Streptomyces marianii]